MRIIRADITQLDVDVIVNSAHPTLMAGSGMSGAIHKAAGPMLEHAAKAFGPIAPGQAVTTKAFNLPSKYVIHAVAPRFLRGDDEEVATLAKTYHSVIHEYANLSDVSSLAIPSLGTGIYRWPLEIAANIAMQTLSAYETHNMTICVFDSASEAAYSDAVTKLKYTK
jgi:O-acetyl-ADP-ribose deacetylase (regulator of RNase III)